MPLTQLAPPYPIFTDKNGDPLDAGYLYFGTANLNPETNPIQVYYDSALTQPAAQPLRTSNGYVMRNGSPALIYANAQFSVTVRNKNNELVIYSPVGYGILPGTSATSTDQITYNQGGTGAVSRLLTARLQDYVSVKDFGAVGDGLTDDTAALQAAVLAARGYELFFPPGVYIVTDTLTLHDTNRLRLSPDTVLRAGSAISGAILDLPQVNTSGVREKFGIYGGQIDGNSLAQTGISIVNASWRNQILIQAVRVIGCLGDGVNMFRCQGPVIQAVFCQNNGGRGFNFRGCNAMSAFGITALSNGTDGIRIASEIGTTSGGSPVTFSGGMSIVGFTAEANARDGVFLDGADGQATPSTLIAGWIEQNTRDGIRAELSRAVIQGCRISGLGTGTNRGINLVSGGSYHVFSNSIGISGGSADYQQSANFGAEDASTRSVVGPNFSGSFLTFETVRAEVVGANVVTNPGFETGNTTGWNKDGATTITAQTGTVADGVYAVQVDYGAGGSDIRQSVTTLPGALYRARFKYRANTADPSPPSIAFRTIDAGVTKTSAGISLATKDQWFDAEFHFIATSATVDFRVISSGGSGTVFLDTFDIVPVYRQRAVATRMYDKQAEFAQPAPIVLS